MIKEKIVGNVKVVMCLTENEGLCVDDGGKWVLICETHAYIVQDTNKKRLWQWASNPADWCGGCQGTDARFEKVGA